LKSSFSISDRFFPVIKVDLGEVGLQDWKVITGPEQRIVQQNEEKCIDPEKYLPYASKSLQILGFFHFERNNK
jgi:hypothetical protein